MKNFRLYMMSWTLLWLSVVSAQGQSFTALWNQLKEAEQKDLPQTVIQLAGRIEQQAAREKQAGQLFKALLWREHYQQKLTPDSLFPAIARMERWSAEEQDGMNRALLHTILATQYAQYLDAASYRIDQRTALFPEEVTLDM